jgi:hypothetical protein
MLKAAQGCSGLLRLGTALHSYSSGLLIHRLGYSHACLGLKVEMEFREVKFSVRVMRHFEGFSKCIKRFCFLCLRVGALLVIYIIYINYL